MPSFKLLLSDPAGTVLEHPTLLAAVRSDEHVLPPRGRPIALPSGAKLAHLPGRRPVGLNPKTGALELVREFTIDGKTFAPNAVGAVLPPGYTRTYLPGGGEGRRAGAAAVGVHRGGVGAEGAGGLGAAHRSPHALGPVALQRPRGEGPGEGAPRALPRQPGARSSSRCARSSTGASPARTSSTASDEGGIPASVMCNAQCVGCISRAARRRAARDPRPHERRAGRRGDGGRRGVAPGARHGPHHGELRPGLRGRAAHPLALDREGHSASRASARRRAAININTNGSLPHGLRALFDAGLDAVRVSLNSAHPELYAAYYQPKGYGFARRGGVDRGGAEEEAPTWRSTCCSSPA